MTLSTHDLSIIGKEQAPFVVTSPSYQRRLQRQFILF